jgi:hypothetical protein
MSPFPRYQASHRQTVSRAPGQPLLKCGVLIDNTLPGMAATYEYNLDTGLVAIKRLPGVSIQLTRAKEAIKAHYRDNGSHVRKTKRQPGGKGKPFSADNPSPRWRAA